LARVPAAACAPIPARFSQVGSATAQPTGVRGRAALRRYRVAPAAAASGAWASGLAGRGPSRWGAARRSRAACLEALPGHLAVGLQHIGGQAGALAYYHKQARQLPRADGLGHQIAAELTGRQLPAAQFAQPSSRVSAAQKGCAGRALRL
nr:hypothetical protein [Tanacetum cinerariifolium]